MKFIKHNCIYIRYKCSQFYLSFNVQDFQNARGEMNGVNFLQIDICYYDSMKHD